MRPLAALVQESLAEAGFDDLTRCRLMRCLPALNAVLDGWDGRAPTGALMIAAVTANSGLIVHASDWPDLDTAQCDDAAAALAVAVRAPSANSGNVIVASLSVLLGPLGRARQRHDAACLIEQDLSPLTVAMIDQQRRDMVAAVTVIGLPRPTLH